MAITAAQLQAQLGTGNMDPQVLREFGVQGTTQGWLISGGAVYPGVVKMITTVAADAAATQKTTTTGKLVKGGAGHD